MSERIEESPPTKRSGRTIALLLIGVGLLFLVHSSGLFNEALWNLLWPLLLVGVGIDLATEGRYRRMVIMGTLLAAIIFAPLVGLSRLFSGGFWSDRYQAGEIVPLDDMQRLKANITLTAGKLKIDDMSGFGNQAVDLGESREGTTFTKEGETGILDISETGGDELDLDFRRDLPLDLTIDIAAGDKAELDLEHLRLERLDLEFHLGGKAEIKLPEERALQATINSSAGDIEIEIPRNLSARIEIDGSSNVEVDDSFQKDGNAYLTKNYNEDAHAVIDITSNGSNVKIKY